MWSITCPCPMRKPARALGRRYGALVMDSIPPATTTSTEWAVNRSCANIAAFMPEPHILLTVVQPAASGRPAPSDAWRAGAWPCPAGSTQPMITSWTCSCLIFARSTAARIAAAPSSGALKPFISPWKAPMGVRAAETITIGSGFMEESFQVLDGLQGFGLETRDQLCSGQGTRERRRLARPHGDEIRFAGLRRSGAQLGSELVLGRKGDLRKVLGFRLAQESIGEAARRLAREFLGDARVVFGCFQQQVFMHLRGAAFGAGDERGAELRGLRAKRQHGCDALAVHDAAGRDDRQLHGAHDHARERERAG